MKRRLLAALLTCVMLFSLLPATALAEEGDVAQIGENTYATLDQAVAAAADGVHLVAAFGHMHEHAGFQDFVVQPLAEVLGNDLREEGVVLAGSDIGDTTFHGFCRIVTGRNKSHFCSPL